MSTQRPTSCELFNVAAEAFGRGDLSSAVTSLRGGFFENLYVAPILLGEEFHPQRIWYSGPDSEPRSAREYVERYGHLWEEDPRSLEFLSIVWNDPLVRAELKNFLNLSRNLLSVRSNAERSDLLRERGVFLSPERLKRTQSEIVGRIERRDLSLPLPKPRLGLVLLASRDPSASVSFYRRLIDVEPVTTSQVAGGYVEFELEGVHIAIHGQDRTGSGDPYGLGEPPKAFGWGAIFVFRVSRLDTYLQNAERAGIDIIDSDLTSAGRRFFVVKDPSGYLIEITEEEPRGLELF